MSSAFMKADELLPPEQLEQLGTFARRLYAGAWNRLRDRNLNSIWIHDEEMCQRANIPAEQLAKVQNELDQSGLMRVTPGLVQSKYDYFDLEAETQD